MLFITLWVNFMPFINLMRLHGSESEFWLPRTNSVCAGYYSIKSFYSLSYLYERPPLYCPVGGGSRIHRLLLCRGLRPPHECPGYDTKQSDGDVPAVLELCGMQSTPSLPSFPGPLWPGVVAPDKGPIYGLNRTKLCFIHYTDFCI